MTSEQKMRRHIYKFTEIAIALMPFHWAIEFYRSDNYVQIAFGPFRFSVGWPTEIKAPAKAAVN